ncbi:rhodanese-like domain-containing protein [Desulfurivibrio alkaliphilus]|uniref:Rhodanese domain protein n=1 Tax=Desulfurivibrio alkaliphilus (strain DSM 19089 / UNIQEM U267 / AHT2) TaxID=589865 RepID=D6Z1I7_DESAT|nr:rhodanese-like domain-containing protein [Desulfurivibrio alkaliphilus]ADH87321.1 Rhodanese domain protein [Desulfurivibrio alkaliphilus AHT 2]
MFKYAAMVGALLLVLGVGSAQAFFSFFSGGYQYISAEELNKRLQAGDEMVLLDICPADEFAEGHIPGSIETNAFPTQTAEERKRLSKGLAAMQAGDEDIIIICPGGGGGARRTVDYYVDQGIAKDRIYILEDGLRKWPYETVPKS